MPLAVLGPPCRTAVLSLASPPCQRSRCFAALILTETLRQNVLPYRPQATRIKLEVLPPFGSEPSLRAGSLRSAGACHLKRLQLFPKGEILRGLISQRFPD